MDLTFSPRERELQEKASHFASTFLFPNEVALEEHGLLPPELRQMLTAEVLAAQLNAINHSEAVGGQGLSLFEQTIVNEQLGMATGGLSGVAWQPPIPLKDGTQEQRKKYLEPNCQGRRHNCFAISEKYAGSDPREVRTSAIRKGDRYYLSGEKWFVTHGDIADYIIVHAHVDGDPDKPTLFLVDKDTPGVSIKRTPKYMHTFITEHPEISFENVELGEDAILGDVGMGLELTKDWFVETRVKIAAHSVGAATRATNIANEYAAERVQFGRAIRDFQAIEFMLADMAVEIMAAKTLVYRVAWHLSHLEDRKFAHAQASAVKLHATEMAGRVIDKALQILGGRGYMRENPVERLYRDTRVERIWEGTSEIQRMVIGRQIKKRGLAGYTGWIE